MAKRWSQHSSPAWRYEEHLSNGHENKIICVYGSLAYLTVSLFSWGLAKKETGQNIGMLRLKILY
jgi:hypothetical protein